MNADIRDMVQALLLLSDEDFERVRAMLEVITDAYLRAAEMRKPEKVH